MAKTIECDKCGYRVDEHAHYCSNCGQKITIPDKKEQHNTTDEKEAKNKYISVSYLVLKVKAIKMRLGITGKVKLPTRSDSLWNESEMIVVFGSGLSNSEKKEILDKADINIGIDEACWAGSTLTLLLDKGWIGCLPSQLYSDYDYLVWPANQSTVIEEQIVEIKRKV